MAPGPSHVARATLVLAGVHLFASAGKASDSWAVRCSTNCKGRNVCDEVCHGKQEQTHKCPDMASCPTGEDSPCPPGADAVPCKFTDWSHWSHPMGCTGLCSRTRKVVKNRCGGKPCEGPLSDSKVCIAPCKDDPKDCVLAEWGEWSSCGSTTKNQMERSRVVKSPAESGGQECTGALTETRSCGPGVKPMKDCEVSEWLVWSPCTTKCDVGQKSRVRVFVQKADQGGAPCSMSLSETTECSVRPCDHSSATACTMTSWSTWTTCGEETSTTQRTRKREILSGATMGGEVCNDPLEEIEPCKEGEVKTSAATPCQLSVWSEWQLCDKDCGGGQTVRKRSVVEMARNGGKLCTGALTETTACNTHPCAILGVPCRVSLWSEWASCSTSCGTGSQERSRKVLSEAEQDGMGCDMTLSEVRGCLSNPVCKVTDCIWGKWADWGKCSATCDSGYRSRSRSVMQHPTPGGKPCESGDSNEVMPCKGLPSCEAEADCVDGKWTDWEDWSACTKTCRGGLRFHSRRVASEPSTCGKPLVGPAKESDSCNVKIECVKDADCKLGDWSHWTDCTDQCEGTQKRSRKIEVHPAGGGASCGEDASLEQVQSCGNSKAPECGGLQSDCKLGDWTPWSACSVTCGGAQHNRTREVVSPAKNGGRHCKGALRETAPCGTEPCGEKVDCEWSPWSDWSDCAKCSGQKFRHRKVTKTPQFGGKECELAESEQTDECPRDCDDGQSYCVWASWTPFSDCSATCGSGLQSRTRPLTFTDKPGANPVSVASTPKDCNGTLTDVQACPDLQPCTTCKPQECVWGPWSAWTKPLCEGLCFRQRRIQQANNECGEPCSGQLRQMKACPADCSKKDCKLSDWTPWSVCPTHYGQKYQSRQILVAPSLDGEGCYGELNATASCATGNKASVDCELSLWSAWGPCDRTCGGGQQSRNREVLQEASNNGRACESDLSVTRPCSMEKCPVEAEPTVRDCQMGLWSEWGHCHGIANQQVYRKRIVLSPPGPGGKACEGGLQETKQCPQVIRDCRLTMWSEWTDCDSPCAGGQHTRSRVFDQHAGPGGTQCKGSLLETEPCDDSECISQLDCLVSAWSIWSSCSASCGDGFRTRFRNVDEAADPGGVACDKALREATPCEDNPPCGTRSDCKWQLWSQWSDCVPAHGSCGVGYKLRKRDISRFPSGGGRQCPPRIKEEVIPVENCGGQPKCCIDGEWADWGEWSGCTATCGTGTSKRTRALAREETWCGTPAQGSAEEYGACQVFDCEGSETRDCEFGNWKIKKDQECSAKCFGHVEMVRRIKVPAGDQGKCNGPTAKLAPCNPADGEEVPEGCAMTEEEEADNDDCQLSEWSEWTECSATCQVGFRKRSREVKALPKRHGANCESSLQETKRCNPDVPCFADRVNCEWTEWTEWSECDANDEKFKTRGIAKQEANGGAGCQGSQKEVTACGDCVVQTYRCFWDEWDPWSQCSASCGDDGVRTRSRSLKVDKESIPALKEFSLPAALGQQLHDVGAARYSRDPQELLGAFAIGAASLLVFVVAARAGSVGYFRWRHRRPELPEYSAVAQL